MGRKRPERTERRARERGAVKLVQERERLFALSPGGTPERPLEVVSSSVVEPRARALPCPQCAGELIVEEHAAQAGLRSVRVRCRRCQVARTLWFRLGTADPN